MISALRRARTLIAGTLVASLVLIATQAPIVIHEVSHWAEHRAEAATAPSPEHRHDEMHFHRHAAEHDHEVQLQKVPWAIAPARFFQLPDQQPLPISELTAAQTPFFASRVSDRSVGVRGPPPPLALSFPPAYSTAPPAA